jgi:hypothetical protein
MQEMLDEENEWDLDPSSGYSDYDYNARDSDDGTIASSMLGYLPSGGDEKPKKKKSNGMKKKLAPKMMIPGVSKPPSRQQMQSGSFLEDEEQMIEEMPQDVAEKIVGTVVIKGMEGHFAQLNPKINNLKKDVSTIKTTVASLVEENKKLGKVRRHVPASEMQQQMTPEHQ